MKFSVCLRTIAYLVGPWIHSCSIRISRHILASSSTRVLECPGASMMPIFRRLSDIHATAAISDEDVPVKPGDLYHRRVFLGHLFHHPTSVKRTFFYGAEANANKARILRARPMGQSDEFRSANHDRSDTLQPPFTTRDCGQTSFTLTNIPFRYRTIGYLSDLSALR